MSIFEALVLGIVQGLTEFLPVSSSGHLILVPRIFGLLEQPLVFDTTIHLGTAAALVVFFWRDLFKIGFSFVKDLFSKKLAVGLYSPDSVLGLKLLVASIPAAIFGVIAGDFLEETFRSVGWVILFSAFGTILMVLAEILLKMRKDFISEPSFPKSVAIGVFQTLALFSGVSRSGATISGGMILGLTRESAARFSFLMSVPIVVMAGVFSLVKSFSAAEALGIEVLLIGFLTSFVAGLAAIKVLMSFVRSHSLWVFVVYRVALILLLLFLVG